MIRADPAPRTARPQRPGARPRRRDDPAREARALLEIAIRTFDAAGETPAAVWLAHAVRSLLTSASVDTRHPLTTTLPPTLRQWQQRQAPDPRGRTRPEHPHDGTGTGTQIAQRFLAATNSARHDHAALWRGLLAHQLHTRIRGIRPAAGRVLIRLLEAAGDPVPIDELTQIARTCSRRDMIIKVYISQIRAALRTAGIARPIERTPPDSYRIHPATAERILTLMASHPQPRSPHKQPTQT